jgi:prophage regulatory protein
MNQTLDEMLRLPRVCQVTGKSARQIYREIAAAKFPKPVKDGTRSAWLASEIAEWQRARIAERDTVARCVPRRETAAQGKREGGA